MSQLRIAFVILASTAVISPAQRSAVRPPGQGAFRLVEANVPVPAIAGLPLPRLGLTPGPIIDGRKEGLDRISRLTIAPDGQIVAQIGYKMLRGYDSTGRRHWSVDLRGQDEIGNVDAMGWRGSELWISDGRYSQIVLLDHGAIKRSIEMPSWIRPTFADRKAFPVFGRADVLALFGDGSMVVQPRRPHTFGGTTDYDSTMQYVVRTDENGIIQGAVAKFASLDAAQMSAWDRASTTHAEIPNRWIFQRDFWPRLEVSSDGARIVTVAVDTTSATTDSIVVVTANDRGRTLWTRKFGFPRRQFSQREIDSLARRRLTQGDVAARARQMRAVARKLPSVHSVLVGRDYSVWITLRDDNAVRPVVGLDAAGQVIGTAYVPNTFVVWAADRDRLWIVDDRWSAKTIVRYAIAARR